MLRRVEMQLDGPGLVDLRLDLLEFSLDGLRRGRRTDGGGARERGGADQ